MTESMPFAGIATFLKSPFVPEPAAADGEVVIIGVPYDEGTTGRAGAREGSCAAAALLLRVERKSDEHAERGAADREHRERRAGAECGHKAHDSELGKQECRGARNERGERQDRGPA